MKYARPNQNGSILNLKGRYGNFIGGEWTPPNDGLYFQNNSPVNGQPICEIPRSNSKDIDKALESAHRAKVAWA